MENTNYTICEWDSVLGKQVDRVATSEEQAELIAIASKLPTEADYVAAIDTVLNTGAAIRTYDNIITASLRAGYPGPFQEEGLLYATWMDTVWAFGHSYLAQVYAGKVPQPTVEEFITMLPVCPVIPR